MGTLVELPLHELVPAPNIPAGLNPLVVMAVAHTLRNAADGGYGPCKTAPIRVRSGPDGRWEITDGRHRWMAHWIAGKSSALCEIETTDGRPKGAADTPERGE